MAAQRRRPLQRPQRASRRQDAAHLLAFEAAFVGLLLVSSVAFVVTTDSEKPRARPTVAPMEDLVGDLLAALHDLPATDRFQTTLEKVVAKSVVGNVSAFESLVDRTTPPGTECRLWLDNGHERRLLIGPSERLARESVSKSQLFRPAWAYAFALPTIDLVSEYQPLAVQTYTVSQGSLVKEHGIPLQATLSTEDGVYGRAAVTGVRDASTVSLYMLDEGGSPGFGYEDNALTWQSVNVHQSSAAGALPQPLDISVPRGHDFLNVTAIVTGLPVAYVLTFTDPNAVPWPLAIPAAGTWELSIPNPTEGTWNFTSVGTLQDSILPPQAKSARLYANATALEGNRNWTFVVEHEAGDPIPEGTTLNVTFPSVFSAIQDTDTSQPGWRDVTAVDDLDLGAWVRAVVDQDVSGGDLRLNVTAKRPLNADALHAVHAVLSNGTAARSTFALVGTAGTTSTPNTIEHDLYLSVPKPVGPGSSSLWGAVFPHPRAAAALPEEARQLDLVVADGTPVFADVVGLEPAGTWQVLSPTHLRWTGSEDVGANKALGFAFRVEALGDPSADEPAIQVPLRFENGYEFPMTDQERPYIYSLNVPPSEDILGEQQRGYYKSPDSGATTRGDADLEVALVQRGLLVQGEAIYGTTAWGSVTALQEALRNGFARSHLNLSKTQVRLGEQVDIEVDFEGVFDDVVLPNALTVTAWSVDIAVYDPAQPFVPFAEMEPSFRGSFGSDVSLEFLTEKPDLEAIAEWVLGGPADVSTRAHAIVPMVAPMDGFYGPHAVIAQATFAVSDGISTTMVQSARQLAIIDVVPDAGQGVTGLYWATLECWLPDW